jgi:Flp pilus assembly pilin Flp
MLRTVTLKHLARFAQHRQRANALEYSLVFILVAFAIVTSTSAWGIGVVFEFLASSRITQIIGLAGHFV